MKDEVVVGEIFEIDISDKIQEVYPKLMDLEVTPSKEQQIFNHEGEYGYDNVTVNAVTSSIDENIKSENIKNGINILGIEGTLKPGKPEQTKTIISSKEEQMVVPDEGFELSKVIVKPIPLQVKEVVPSTEAIEVVPDEQNFVLEKVVVLPAPLEIKETKSKPSEIVEVIPEGENIGLKKVIVNPIILSNKTIVPTKELQKVEPDIDTDGLSYVNIEPIPDEYIIPDGNLEINQNGTYDVTDKANAIVDVPEKVLGTKTITKNGTYNAIDDNLDGYSQVEVTTSGVDINDYFETTYSGTSPSSWVANSFIKKTTDIVIDDSVTSLQSFCANIGFCPKIICNSNVQRMNYMYSKNLSSIIDVSGLNTSNVTAMDYMFNGAKPTSIDLSNFDTHNVKTMYSMFGEFGKNIENLDLSNYDTSNVESMGSMFQYTIIKKINLSSFNTSKVYSFNNMFYGCGSLTELDVSNFDTSYALEMNNMFDSCGGLTELDLSSWNTSRLTSINSMFRNCINLITLNISNWDTSNIKDYGMNNLFAGCKKLVNLNISNWNTSKVKYMNYVFENCEGLTNLDLSNWDTNNVVAMAAMFRNCTSLTNLDIRKFDFSKVTTYTNMFGNVPTDCLIIVKDDTAKTWITSKFTTLTNVKTVAELGA